MALVGAIANLWNVWQQSQIDEQAEKTASLEEQVKQLHELHARHHELLRRMLVVLEHHLGQDIDQDGTIGALLESQTEPVPGGKPPT